MAPGFSAHAFSITVHVQRPMSAREVKLLAINVASDLMAIGVPATRIECRILGLSAAHPIDVTMSDSEEEDYPEIEVLDETNLGGRF